MGDWTQDVEDDEWLHEEFDFFETFKDRRIARAVQRAQAAGKYGPYAAYAFTINYILGVGCLGIPYAISQAGLVLGPIILLLVTAFSFLTSVWVAESVARAQKLATLPCECGHRRWMCLNDHSTGVVPEEATKPSELDALIDRPMFPRSNSHKATNTVSSSLSTAVSRATSSSLSSFFPPSSPSILLKEGREHRSSPTRKKIRQEDRETDDDETDPAYSFAVPYSDTESTSTGGANVASAQQGEKCYEVVELCYKFQGTYGRAFYQVALLMLMYVGLLAYTQVFNKTVLQYFGLSDSVQWIVTGVYALCVVPLSCFELSEQIEVQVAMALMRFVSLAAMILAAVFGIWQDPYDGGGSELVPPPSSPPFVSPGIRFIDLSHFGLIFSAALFSQLFQHSVPGLLNPLPLKDKNSKSTVLGVFGFALTTTLVAYLTLGISCAMYFGPRLVEKSVNLNFASFSWGLTGDIPMWVLLIQALIVLFPAMDTFSVFPLIAVTLGNNFASFFPKLPIYLHNHYTVSRRSYLTLCRLFACVPPILLSLLLTDLALTIQLSGFCGVYVAFIAPALLQYYSSRSCFRQFGSSRTIYSGFYSHSLLVVLMLIFSAFALAVLLHESLAGPA
eukprot:gb/GEZN01003497.1/.p1 GENE.gb/GEZN01003497.1/~~gb/GEZN01003497.1/.p1  ORF type:complete len:618 (-),score=82.41 gb/GEZN01003497.1/:142-1995(-)